MGDLDTVWTQEQFGLLVGISQPAVSDLMARDVIAKGDTARVWLLAYCDHLRETAAGRDPDGLLSTERARVAKETADRIALQNAVTRKEFAPVGLLEVVLSDVARQIATRLDALLPQILRRVPDLAPAVVAHITDDLVLCRDLCANASISQADRIQAEEDAIAEGADV